MTYWTVSAMVVVWVVLPEVAVMVTCWTPDGVPGVAGGVGAVGAAVPEVAGIAELEQPTARPVVASSSMRSPSNCSGALLPVIRLREKSSSEPKGRRKAAAMVAVVSAQGPRCCSFAMLAVVWQVMVLVAGAVGVTVRVLGEKEQVTPTGPLQDRATLPLKLLTGATLMVAMAELPAVTVAAEVEALKPKAAGEVEAVVLAMPANRPWASLVRPAAM